MDKFRRAIGKVPTGILTGIILVLILWLTLAPHPTGHLRLPLIPGADKIVHLVMFGVLTFVVLLEIMKHRNWDVLSLPTVGTVTFICALFGLGIEILQRAMGLGRTFEVLDILADAAGAFAAGGIWAMIQGALSKED